MEDKELIRGGFVLYKSTWDSYITLKKTNPELAEKLLEAIINYGFYKEVSDDPIISAIMCPIQFGIDNAAFRHDKAVEDGKKGGAKKVFVDAEIISLKKQGKTHKEISEIMGCSEKTVQRAVKVLKNQGQTDEQFVF